MNSAKVSLGTGSVEDAVRARYADASHHHEPCLCAPSDGYDPKFLKVLPQEIIERDYGCGDPSVHVRAGETVLDLGSGSGKVCYICAQKVGPSGQVIGVDFNQPMLELARKYQGQITERMGYSNTSFRKGRIQDLRLDLDLLDQWLAQNPIRSADDYLKLQAHADHLRSSAPLVADSSIDVVISNCVLNLVRSEDKRQLFEEMFRVLKVGGRCVIADIVSDEEVPAAMAGDPNLWSGCISGALREDRFLKAFEDASFRGITIVHRAEQPWQVINGIEFRPVTVQAFKGKHGPCLEGNQAVICCGPDGCG